MKAGEANVSARQKKDPAFAGGASQRDKYYEAYLGRTHVRCGRSLRGLLHVELDLLPLGQALEAGTLNSGMMHEYIFAAVARGDEAEALRVVKPLYGSCCHENTSCRLNCDVLQFVS